ncbi:phospholipase A and acyltransferase 3-like [Erpetoichthys calabaricus]|uniref:HRAS-like suppressor 3 n=1 Tax=Erpetoichthys calabaricus TaxID=27687 RepID=A0A8C4RZR1_ERPCA|nr:phospholipase A and acyltransferase 3-like [Erpetoichthys calabaricus]XP_051788636.1 phospholipase A and acyltransferase 3-like [Erpetoichthys calabaricus]
MGIVFVLYLLVSVELISASICPEKGDLIKVKRMLYTHWAVYVGNGSAIHTTGILEELSERYLQSLSPKDVPSEQGFHEFLSLTRRNSTAGDSEDSGSSEAQREYHITKEKFQTILAADTFAVANSQYDNRELPGFNFKPFSKSKILERLNRFVGKIYPYSLLYLNCEHFCTFVRYGTAISDQAERFLLSLRKKKRISVATKKLEDLMNA